MSPILQVENIATLLNAEIIPTEKLLQNENNQDSQISRMRRCNFRSVILPDQTVMATYGILTSFCFQAGFEVSPIKPNQIKLQGGTDTIVEGLETKSRSSRESAQTELEQRTRETAACGGIYKR